MYRKTGKKRDRQIDFKKKRESVKWRKTRERRKTEKERRQRDEREKEKVERERRERKRETKRWVISMQSLSAKKVPNNNTHTYTYTSRASRQAGGQACLSERTTQATHSERDIPLYE